MQSVHNILGVIETFGDVFHVGHSVRLHGVVLGAAFDNVDNFAIAAFAIADGVDDRK